MSVTAICRQPFVYYDESINLNVYRTLNVELCGIARRTSSGQDALETATVFRPEIILCDLSLPDMSGLDLARALRSKPETRDAVIALHTAVRDLELSTLEEANATEIDLVLAKPLTGEKVDKLFARFALRRQES